MRVTNKLMDNLVSEGIGIDALPVVKFLKNRRNISEFKIAEKVDLNINTARNILYRLYEKGLVSYTRKKDFQKGWYVSFWTFKPKRIKYLMLDLYNKKLELLRTRLNKEKNSENCFYMCPNMCIRMDFDTAHDFVFKCPECGTLLNHTDNSKTIEHIESEIKNIEKVLK